MRINVYLSFDGRCAEAFAFYARVLGGSVAFTQTYGESPMAGELPPEQHGLVMHAQLAVAGTTVYGADAPPQWRTRPDGFSVSLNLDDLEEARRVFDALAEGGTVKMPLGPTFWARGFGMLIDRFEIPWMVNVGDPA